MLQKALGRIDKALEGRILQTQQRPSFESYRSHEKLEKVPVITFFLFSRMADQEITCRDCGATFTFTEGEQEFYAGKNLSAPQRCKSCRSARKTERSSAPRELHDAVCAQCGSQCQVPFKPRPVEEGGKPVLCKACFTASRGM